MARRQLGVAATNADDAITASGTATLSNKTLTTPKISQINDANGVAAVTIQTTTTAVNNFNIFNNTTGNAPGISAVGSDPNISFAVTAKGTSSVICQNGSGIGATITASASSVNWVNISGRATGVAPTVAATGSDPNVSLNLTTRGSGTVQANSVDVVTTTGTQTQTNKTLTSPIVNQILDSNGNVVQTFSPIASAVNYFTSYNAATGGTPALSANGSDATVNMAVQGKGTTGSVLLRESSNRWVLAATPSTTAGNYNYLQVKNADSGAAPSIAAISTSDAAVGLNLKTVGSGAVQANGNPVGVKVSVPATATSSGIPGQWAADDSWHYTYTGDGSTHKWRRVAHASW
jgi:hypothetical protein